VVLLTFTSSMFRSTLSLSTSSEEEEKEEEEEEVKEAPTRALKERDTLQESRGERGLGPDLW